MLVEISFGNKSEVLSRFHIARNVQERVHEMLGGVKYLYVQLTCGHTRHQKMFHAILLTHCRSMKDVLSQTV